MLPYRACFHFIGVFCYKALSVKLEKKVSKTLFKGSCYTMPNVKRYFLVNLIYFFYRDSKIKKYGDAAFFKLETFNYKVFSTHSDNSYRQFTPEVRAKVLLLE